MSENEHQFRWTVALGHLLLGGLGYFVLCYLGAIAMGSGVEAGADLAWRGTRLSLIPILVASYFFQKYRNTGPTVILAIWFFTLMLVQLFGLSKGAQDAGKTRVLELTTSEKKPLVVQGAAGKRTLDHQQLRFSLRHPGSDFEPLKTERANPGLQRPITAQRKRWLKAMWRYQFNSRVSKNQLTVDLLRAEVHRRTDWGDLRRAVRGAWLATLLPKSGQFKTHSDSFSFEKKNKSFLFHLEFDKKKQLITRCFATPLGKEKRNFVVCLSMVSKNAKLARTVIRSFRHLP